MTPKPDHRGFYRCSFGCWTNASPYPAPKWRTVAGIEKHMAGCHMRPPDAWVPPPEPIPVYFGNCSGCGCVVFEMQTIWKSGGEFLCYDCSHGGMVLPGGYFTGAGLMLGGLDEFRA